MSKGRVLIVDDEAEIRELLAVVFEDAGYEVDTAPDGLVAVEKLGQTPPDLMTLDLTMPRLDGRGVLQRLQQLPHPPGVIVIAGDERTHLAPYTNCVGAYLHKPCRVDELLLTADKVLASREHLVVRDERRNLARRNVIVDATILSKEGKPIVQGRLVNLSTGGARIELGPPLEPGKSVCIALNIPDEGGPLTVHGEIRWRNQSALGLAFTELEPEVEERLRALLGLDD